MHYLDIKLLHDHFLDLLHIQSIILVNVIHVEEDAKLLLRGALLVGAEGQHQLPGRGRQLIFGVLREKSFLASALEASTGNLFVSYLKLTHPL